MQCPVCKEKDLVMAERQGIEIDYCPECRGVWLDRGELDKIIDRAAPAAAPSPEMGLAQDRRDMRNMRDMRGYGGGYGDGDGDRYGQHGKRKRRGLLGELFDFD